MSIIRCRKGHFYDGEIYGECPHCQNHTELPPEGQGECGNRGGKIIVGTFHADQKKQFVAGWLVCTEGPEKGRAFPLYKGRNHIGRSYKMEVCISEDTEVGRDTHCTVIYDERWNQFHILEGRRTVTYRNGRRLAGQEELTDGDILQLGNSRLEFLAYCKEDRRWK